MLLLLVRLYSPTVVCLFSFSTMAFRERVFLQTKALLTAQMKKKKKKEKKTNIPISNQFNMLSGIFALFLLIHDLIKGPLMPNN